MTSMRDYADKSYLTARTTPVAEESTFEKVAAVFGIVFMIVAVGGMLILGAAPSVPL